MTQEEERKAFEDTLAYEKRKVFYNIIEPKLKPALVALRKRKPTVHRFKASFGSDTIGDEFTDAAGTVVRAAVTNNPDDDHPAFASLGWWMWQLSMPDPASLLLQSWQPEIEVMRLLHNIGTLVDDAACVGISRLEYRFENDTPTMTIIR